MQLAAQAGSSRGVLLLGDCRSLHSLHRRFGPEQAGAYFSRYLSNTIHRRHNVKTVISSKKETGKKIGTAQEVNFRLPCKDPESDQPIYPSLDTLFFAYWYL